LETLVNLHQSTRRYNPEENHQPARKAYGEETEENGRAKDKRKREFEMRIFCGSKMLIGT
jgi:hypothetical protein